jgi:hypothetical protein
VHRLRRLNTALPHRRNRIEERDGMRSTIITGTVVREQPLLSCSECGATTRRLPTGTSFVIGCPDARGRNLGHFDTTVTTVCPILIMSPFFSRWGYVDAAPVEPGVVG